MKEYLVKYIAYANDGKKYNGKAKVKNCFSKLHAKSKVEDSVKKKLKSRYKGIEFTLV